MATAAFSTEASTVTHSLSRGSGGHLRVTFESPHDGGFSLSELDALQAAIEVARRQLLDAGESIEAPIDSFELRVFHGHQPATQPHAPVCLPIATDSEPSLESLFAVQQSRLAAPT